MITRFFAILAQDIFLSQPAINNKQLPVNNCPPINTINIKPTGNTTPATVFATPGSAIL